MKTVDSTKIIAKFIEKKLKGKIQQDLFTYQIIGNEEDLQQSVYHHLRNFIDEQKLTRIKISGKYTIKGTPIWRRKKHKRTKKLEWKKSQQIMPDLIISEIPESEKEALSNKIAIELKATSPSKKNTPDFDASEYENDFKKLNALAESGLQTYYIFIDSDSNGNMDTVEQRTKTKINKKEFSISPRKKTIKKKFGIIIINRFVNPDKSSYYSQPTDFQIEELREKQKRMFRTYPDNIDPRFSIDTKKSKTKLSRKNPKRVAGAKRAWKISPKLRAKQKKMRKKEKLRNF